MFEIGRPVRTPENRAETMTTRDDILRLLNREALTVAEMAERLGVTRNAIVQPLRQHEAAGLVRQRATQRGRVGKPALRYEAVPGFEDRDSDAYPAFAELLVASASRSLTRDQLIALMQSAGQEMASHIDTGGVDDIAGRLELARAFVDRLGAATTLEKTNGELVMRSHTCPLARAVRRDGCVCQAVASFLASVTGSDVREFCDRGDKLTCQFAVKAA